jgi:hypothetical protein
VTLESASSHWLPSGSPVEMRDTAASSRTRTGCVTGVRHISLILDLYNSKHRNSNVIGSLEETRKNFLFLSDGQRAGRPGTDSREEQEFFLFSIASRPALGPTQPPIQWVLEALSPEVKRPGHEADYLPPSSAEVKNGGAIPPPPHTSSW